MCLDPASRFTLVLAATPHMEANDGEDERKDEGFLPEVSVGRPFPYSIPLRVRNRVLITNGGYGWLRADRRCRHW